MSLENYHENHNEKQKEIENKIETIEQRKEQLLQKENISQEELEEIKEEIYSEIDKKAEVAEHVDDYCLLSIANEIKAVNVELSLEKKQEIYHTIEDVDSEIIQARIDAKKEIEDLLKTEMPVSGTIEFRERQSIIADDINNRAKNIKIDEFTYFEELDEYIKNNPLYKQEDRDIANIILNNIKKINPEKSFDIENYISEIKNNLKIKNLFVLYLMMNGLIGKKETSIANVFKKLSFEQMIKEVNLKENILDINLLQNNKELKKYFNESLNLELYKDEYKGFIEQTLVEKARGSIEKEIKIHTLIYSKKWENAWNNIF